MICAIGVVAIIQEDTAGRAYNDRMDEMQLVVIDIGNTRTCVGVARQRAIHEAKTATNGDLAHVTQLVLTAQASISGDQTAPIVIASVNDVFADQLESALADQLGSRPYRVGRDLPIPVSCDLSPEALTGQDRLLNATAAWAVLQQACIVVDAGTAVTVDFIDGTGVFHGGAIAPGASMQLQSLHEHTEALPELTFDRPDDDPFGRDTAQAMLQGVYHGVQGLVRRLAEKYASYYEAYPTIIATGGDAEAIFGADELVDRIVPDLTLLGIAVAAQEALTTASGEDETT